MKVFLASVNHRPEESPVTQAFRRLAAKDRFGVH